MTTRSTQKSPVDVLGDAVAVGVDGMVDGVGESDGSEPEHATTAREATSTINEVFMDSGR
jgi:hypothetical protein